MITENKVQ